MALLGAYENKKTRRLARLLQMPPWAALGLMEAIWHWAKRSARTGRIEPDQWEDLTEYLQWQKPQDDLRKLLVKAGLIEPMEGWDWVHDWDQHADDTLRKSLERHGEIFANGSSCRKWTNNWNRAGSPEVPQEAGKVPQIDDFSEPSHPRAGPEPEPEPEPEPAAAARAPRVREASTAPPPGNAAAAKQKVDLTQIAFLLHRFTPRQPEPPDPTILSLVAGAMNGATVVQLELWLSQRARAGATEPRKYGFWPKVVAAAFKSPAPSDKSPPRCATCSGSGTVANRKLTDELSMAEIDAAFDPCPDCAKGKPA